MFKGVESDMKADDGSELQLPPAFVLINPRQHRRYKKNNEKVLYHPNVYRPWGSFEVLLTKKNYQVKKLIINPKQKISLQKHNYRSEHWVIVSGKATVTKNKKIYILKKNQSIDIPKKAEHRVENKDNTPLVIIEIQTGDKLLENDIIRLEDFLHEENLQKIDLIILPNYDSKKLL